MAIFTNKTEPKKCPICKSENTEVFEEVEEDNETSNNSRRGKQHKRVDSKRSLGASKRK